MISRNRFLGMLIPRILLLCFCLVVAVSGIAPANTGGKGEKMRKDKYPRPEDWSPEYQRKAKQRAKIKYPFVRDVKKEDPTLREMRLNEKGIGIEDIEHDYYLLSSPLVNTYKDKYEPVRFMHAKHAASLDENCAACHHYRPADESKPETVPCRSCHKESFESKSTDRPGLKGAYHLRCMGCHEKENKGPTDCQSCHQRNPVDHSKKVELPQDPKPGEVTEECLNCHEEEGKEFSETAHWLWKGPSEHTVHEQKEVDIGKGTVALNGF